MCAVSAHCMYVVTCLFQILYWDWINLKLEQHLLTESAMTETLKLNKEQKIVKVQECIFLKKSH